MTRFQLTNIVFVVAASAAITAHITMGTPLSTLAGLAIIYSLIVFYGSKNVASGFFIKTVCKTKSDNQVALTFDDGPVKGQTDRILDTLQAHGVKATFFCIGKRMEENPELVNRMVNEGHLVSNHSYTHHFFFDLFPFKRMLAELMDTNKTIMKITGRNNTYFRPPYGVTTPVLAKAVNKSGLVGIGWSVRSYDTILNSPEKLTQRVIEKTAGGDIVLLHDTQEITAKALTNIISGLQMRGLHPVRLDALLQAG